MFSSAATRGWNVSVSVSWKLETSATITPASPIARRRPRPPQDRCCRRARRGCPPPAAGASTSAVVVVLPFVPVTATHGAARHPVGELELRDHGRPVRSGRAHEVGLRPDAGRRDDRSALAAARTMPRRTSAPALRKRVAREPRGRLRYPSPRPSRARPRPARPSERPRRRGLTRIRRDPSTRRCPRPVAHPRRPAFVTNHSANPAPAMNAGDDPEADHDLGLAPALHLEVVMQRRHPEDALAGELERGDLQERPTGPRPRRCRRCSGESSSVLVTTASVAMTAPRPSDPVSPMKMSAGIAVVPQEPEARTGDGRREQRELEVVLRERDGGEREHDDHDRAGRQTVETVGEVHGVRERDDHERPRAPGTATGTSSVNPPTSNVEVNTPRSTSPTHGMEHMRDSRAPS